MAAASGHLAVSVLLLLVAAVSAAGTEPSWRGEQERDRVPRVPGQAFNASFAHYAGYVTVSEDRGAALFYWFFEAADDPASKPLLLWLNGGVGELGGQNAVLVSVLIKKTILSGPGCSSIAYGLGEEVGPFHVNADGKGVHMNPYSWNKVANLLFFDSPVGVGYSYSNTSGDLLSNGDERTAKDSLVFLTKWLERFPQYKEREFYLSGESYAGHYVPQLAQAIKRHHETTGDKSINLKGYMVGNALTDDFHDHYGIFQYMWTTGLISDQTYKLLNIFCDFESFVHSSPRCDKILDIASTEAGNIDSYSIFTPTCHSSFVSSRNKVVKRLRSVGKMGEQYDPCTEKHSTVYFNLAEVQKALHVNPVIGKSKWETCNGVVNTNWKDSERSVLHIYHELIQYGLRIWMFSGDTDSVIPVTSTRYSIDALKLPTVTPWHAWYDDDGEVGGWSQGYKGLNFVTVRGAGHEVPLHRPKQALTLIKSFLAGSPMPVLSDLHSDM